MVPEGRLTMVKTRDLYSKAKQAPQNFAFRKLIKLAESVGFVFRDSKGGGHKGGSHQHIYRHPLTGGMMNFQHGSPKSKAKKYQVEQLLEHIDKHNLLEREQDV